MENGSLDNFIFDELQRHQLQWSVRFKVIIGITKGVVYLHQESRPLIIHRDLNASNIYLDDKMNPKISGFGHARHVGDGQSELSTIVVGTLGHSAPEYIVQRIISEKTDVNSFGVLVLEILSGKRINRGAENFIEYACKLWKEGIRKVFDLRRNPCRSVFGGRSIEMYPSRSLVHPKWTEPPANNAICA